MRSSSSRERDLRAASSRLPARSIRLDSPTYRFVRFERLTPRESRKRKRRLAKRLSRGDGSSPRRVEKKKPLTRSRRRGSFFSERDHQVPMAAIPGAPLATFAGDRWI